MPDHIHLLLGLKPDIALSNLVRDIKANSSRFVNENKYCKLKFQWQEGFGAFSYSHSQLSTIDKYIQNQENHHKKRTFKEEYLELLKKFNVDFDEKYIFMDVE
jgi:REP element-mobilizing transposase RayT